MATTGPFDLSTLNPQPNPYDYLDPLIQSGEIDKKKYDKMSPEAKRYIRQFRMNNPKRPAPNAPVANAPANVPYQEPGKSIDPIFGTQWPEGNFMQTIFGQHKTPQDLERQKLAAQEYNRQRSMDFFNQNPAPSGNNGEVQQNFGPNGVPLPNSGPSVGGGRGNTVGPTRADYLSQFQQNQPAVNAPIAAPNIRPQFVSPDGNALARGMMDPRVQRQAPQSAPGGRSLLDLYRANMNNGRQSVQARDADRFGVNR